MNLFVSFKRAFSPNFVCHYKDIDNLISNCVAYFNLVLESLNQTFNQINRISHKLESQSRAYILV